jgi:hypothetical protein
MSMSRFGDHGVPPPLSGDIDGNSVDLGPLPFEFELREPEETSGSIKLGLTTLPLVTSEDDSPRG